MARKQPNTNVVIVQSRATRTGEAIGSTAATVGRNVKSFFASVGQVTGDFVSGIKKGVTS